MPVSSQRAAPAPACVDGELARLGEEAFDDARARALDALIAGNFDDAVAAFDDAQRLRADNLASVALGAGSQALLEASRAEGGRRAEAARKLRIAGPPRSATMPSERRVVLRQASRSTSRSEPESKRMPPPPDVPVVDGRLGRRVIATSSWRIVVGRPHLTVELGERITVFEYTDALKAERQRIDIGGAWLESGVLMLEAVDGGRSSVERSRLLGVDAATGALLWIRGPHHRTSGMVGGDGILYAAFGVEFGRYRVEALDVRTGTLLHSMPLDAAPRALSASAAGIVVGTDGGSIAISIEGAMSPEAATAPFRRPTAPQQEMARVRCQSMAAVRAFDARDPAAIAPAVDALDAAGAPRAFVRELRAAGARLEAANEGRAVDLTTRAPVLLARAPTTKLPLPRCSPVRLTETWSEWQTPAEASAVAASFGVEGTRQKRFERAIRGPAAELPPSMRAERSSGRCVTAMRPRSSTGARWLGWTNEAERRRFVSPAVFFFATRSRR